MRLSSLHYFPITWPFLLLFFALFTLLVALIELQILKYAYRRLGLPPRFIFAILLGSLLGSAINIPVAELPPQDVVTDQLVKYQGSYYVVPVVQHWPSSLVAINVGGALIPTVLSIYLLVRNRLYIRGPLGALFVALIVHFVAYPVQGVGIAVPVFVAPLAATAISMILTFRTAPQLAYISGTMGTLIGADLLNLYRIHSLGAPVASIGGAGTFDGVFLTGILAVLLSPLSETASGQLEEV